MLQLQPGEQNGKAMAPAADDDAALHPHRRPHHPELPPNGQRRHPPRGDEDTE